MKPPRLLAGCIVVACVCVGMSVSASVSAAPPITKTVDDSVWYDAEKGIVPVEVKPRVDDSLNRESRWLPKPDKIAKPKPQAAATPNTGTGVLNSGLTFSNLIGWLLLILAVGGILALLVYLMSKAEIDLAGNPSSRHSGANGGAPDEQMIERMKHLPTELRRTDVNLRSEAERLMNLGLYDQAIILLFGHQLLTLDRAGLLRLNRGKTNRKYVRETNSVEPSISQRLSQTVNAFERSYFGRHSIEQTEFAELWQSGLEMERSVDAMQGAAA